MTTETETLEQFFAAINRNDMHAMITHCDPQIVRVNPRAFPQQAPIAVSRVQEHVRRGRETWAEGACEPEKFLVNGDKVVAYLHAWVRLKDSTDWVGGRFTDGFVLRDGKIIQYLSFGDRAEALEWAAIEDREAPVGRS
jgi:ketosteroid isomerase-like protein